MSYITPNSKIQLFKGINLDNRYLHTVHFANASAQNSAFSARVFKTYNDVQFRRVNSTQVRIEEDSTELQGVTYMRFQNRRTGDKWYYAFVLSCDYVNENTSLITYEIDVMQTWFEQGGSVRPCMVKREHTNNDTFGNNLEPEGVGSDSYEVRELTFYSDLADYGIVIQTTGEPDNEELLCQNIFDATHKIILPCDDTTDAEMIKTGLQQLLGSWDAGERMQEVIDMTMMPWEIANDGALPREEDIDFHMPTSFDNYRPKNNKLWMYPFSYLVCTTKCGDGATYRWEYFKDVSPQSTTKIVFTRLSTLVGGGQMMCYPKWYNGITKNIDCNVSFSDFPKCAYTYDAYQAWIASGGKTKYENERALTTMKGASAVLKSYGNALSTAQSASTPMSATTSPQMIGTNVVSGATKVVTNAIDTGVSIQEAFNKVNYMFKDAMYEPNHVVGYSSPSIACGNRIPNFYFQHVHLKDDEAKRVDDFFSCFGYATNRVKQPNLTGRRFWNFVQTENAVISGDMPSSSKEAIGRIFDGGITIWHNIEQIGNYQQSISDDTINNPII